jgi:hypothetical protein
VPINTLTETVVPFAEAARRLPRLRGDRPVNPATLWRWASSGLRGVVLETCRVGGTRCTSLEALSRFFAALTGRGTGPVDLPDIAARCRRLETLMIGLMREHILMGKGDDPLLYLERLDYLAAVKHAVSGLENARVVLAKARQRIEGRR